MAVAGNQCIEPSGEFSAQPEKVHVLIPETVQCVTRGSLSDGKSTICRCNQEELWMGVLVNPLISDQSSRHHLLRPGFPGARHGQEDQLGESQIPELKTQK